MKAKFYIVSALIAAFIVGCNPITVLGSGYIVTEAREVTEFSSINLAWMGEMTIVLGEKESLRIEAEENLLPYIESKVKSKTLVIENKSLADLKPSQPIRYFITVKSLEGLTVSSLGNVTAPIITADSFKIKILSTGNITLDGLFARHLDVELMSTGNVVIWSGTVDHQDITLKSTGTIMLENLKSKTADIDILSSGTATVWVTDTLDATIKSSGSVFYFGVPILNVNTTSSGQVLFMGNK